MRILVVTRSYPAAGDLYKYPFVHRRVLAYRAAGNDVAVFRPDSLAAPSTHMFDGIACLTGNAEELRRFCRDWKPDVLAAHGLTETMWEVLGPAAVDHPVRAWLHGSEIPEFMRQKAMVAPPAERAEALRQVERRRDFWSGFFDRLPGKLELVFVSETSVGLAAVDWAGKLDCIPYSVIPNPVDTELFAYREKRAEDTFRVLLIRPFDSQTYANDLAVEAISSLIESDRDNRLGFTIIGDGPLFDQTLAPLQGRPAVTIERRFLRQDEIAAEHRKHGIFLVPTRLDTQGVSRDEAMASGLVPVTNAIPAVIEFVDDSCAALAQPDNASGLAEAIRTMITSPGLFLARSKAAADRIRADRSNAAIIPRELRLLEEAANG